MAVAAIPPIPVHVDWESTVRTSRTTLTTHLWAAPPLRRPSPIHDRAFAAFRGLKADYARFLAFWTHPHLAVPALEPPTAHTTSWDCTRLDEFVEDFMAASEGRPVVANLATVPAWMFETGEPVQIGTDVDATIWDYERGTVLRDGSLTEVADYFERMARWYLDGGFTDELGRRHTSGHRYRFAYWEVLCEPDIGHQWDPATYTRFYDEVVRRLRPLDPDMRYVGLSLSPVTKNPEYFWHFLDPVNHADGIAVDAISHHFYATPRLTNPYDAAGNLPFHSWAASFFAQAEGFLHEVGLIESIKQRLSPNTQTHINEIGTFNADVLAADPDIPGAYWALGGAVVAFLWSRLTAMGIDLVGVAEFVGYPGVVPGVSLLNWETGEPNARYRVLELLLRHFGPGDRVVPTAAGSEQCPEPPIHAQGFVTDDGVRRILLVNTSADVVAVETGAAGTLTAVDADSGSAAPEPRSVDAPTVALGPFASAVLELR